jgi:3-hydroxybutyrate dehydrogenase
MNRPEHFSPKDLAPASGRRNASRPSFECISLLLQAAGALGAYQAGVYQALAEENLHPDRVAGISIGAIKVSYVTAKHGLIGLAKIVAKEGAKHGVRANVICLGFVRTPLVDKQIPEQARELGISEQSVIKDVMLKETVDGEFTTVEDVAQLALLFASFGFNALAGQSLVVSHGGFMQ